MGTRMKGIYKGFKYTISQIFVVKEREMEIGYPTDVKHLAHIGWDGHSGTVPTWMNEFETGPDFASTSVANSGSAPISLWSSQDFSESTRQTSESDMSKDASFSSEFFPAAIKQKKPKRKKSKSTSSPKSNSSRSLRVAKSISSFMECSIKPPTTTH